MTDEQNICAKVNEREEPFKCLKCEKRFRWAIALKSHVKIHKEDNRLYCKKCDKKFSKVEKT